MPVNALHCLAVQLVADDADLLGVRDAVADAVLIERALEGLGLVRADLGPALGARDRPVEDDGVEHAHGKPRDSRVGAEMHLDRSILALLFDSTKSPLGLPPCKPQLVQA